MEALLHQQGKEEARIREAIANEYLAVKWGLEGLRPTSRQPSARIERIEALHQQLHALIGDRAIVLIAETLAHLPEQPTRYYLQQVLRYELSESEETAYLLDYLLDAWETCDLLAERFGAEVALKIITTPSSQGGDGCRGKKEVLRSDP